MTTDYPYEIEPASDFETGEATEGFAIYAMGDGASAHVCDVLDETQARRIVRAVNAHDVMLAALKVAEAFMRGFEGDEMQEGIGVRLAKVRAAIAKAEEA